MCFWDVLFQLVVSSPFDVFVVLVTFWAIECLVCETCVSMNCFELSLSFLIVGHG